MLPRPALFASILVVAACYRGVPPADGAAESSTDAPDPPAESSTGAPLPIPGTPTSSTTAASTDPEPASSGVATSTTAADDSSSSGVLQSTGNAPSWDGIVADGDRMFFVGNSYTGNDGGLGPHIEKAWPSASVPIHVDTDSRIYWGQGLGSMYTPDVVQTITNGNFDTCVITSGSLGDMLEFVPLVEASCDHFVVYMTWARNPTLTSMQSYRDGTAQIVATMRQLEDTTDARVVPSGLVYYDLLADPPREGLRPDWLYYPQNIHQNGAGIALNVYIFYAALVGESPIGIEYDYALPWDGSPIIDGDRVATRWAPDGSFLYDEIVFDEEFRTALQQRALDVTEAWFSRTTEFD